MIQIKDKDQCCGCNACEQICPKHCITMNEDEEGFLYPRVDMAVCIDCHMCEKVCPIINQDNPRQTLKCFAAKNVNDAVREESSSGGLFTLLSDYILDRNGVVFGARFDDHWDVVHDYAETKEEAHRFVGSKYVQSHINDNYKKAKAFLKQGRDVLFTGTPCQIAGLKKYLRKDYDQLVTLDVACHGVPSPAVWRKYVEQTFGNQEISGVSFRDKRSGWKNYSFTVLGDPNQDSKKRTLLSESFKHNVFMQGFLHNLYLRPSCYNCPSRKFKSGSDITIGDFWGVDHLYSNFDDDKGVGFVCINTHRGENIFSQLSTDSFEIPYQKVCLYNPCLERSVAIPRQRNEFWIKYQQDGIDSIHEICLKMKPGIIRRIASRLKRSLGSIVNPEKNK